MTLRPYQKQLKQSIKTSWAAGNRNVAAVLPTGAGKTITFSDIVKEHRGPVCVIAHRKELVCQMSLALARQEVHHRVIGPDNLVGLINRIHTEELGRSYYHPSASVAVASVDTMMSRQSKLEGWCRSVTLWVQDECFPAGTLVDGKPIESIRVGDVVTSYDEDSRTFVKRGVVRIFKNPMPEELIKIDLRSHHVLMCTGNHPILTQGGWKNARDISTTDELYVVWSTDCEPVLLCSAPIPQNRTHILFETMLRGVSFKNFFRNNGKDEQEVLLRSDEEKESDAPEGDSRKGVENIKRDGTCPQTPWRERKAADHSRSLIIRYVQRLWFSIANYCKYRLLSWGKWDATALQNRLREPSGDDRYRSRWWKSLFNEPSSTGSEEGRFSHWQGVESVQVLKRNDFNPAMGSFVYNLEVDGTHTYTANGIVVHNCHHVISGKDPNKWGRAVQMFPNAKGLGVTATPHRADGLGLGAHADGVFHAMVEGPRLRQLIAAGYLSDYRIFAPACSIDTAGIPLGKDGDYSKPKLKMASRKSHIVGDVLDHYHQFCEGKLTVVFATDVETATDMARRFNDNGVLAAVLSGETPDAERFHTLKRFARREIMVLFNVALFTEGFDLPAIEALIDAAPTMSFAVAVQRWGRVLRKYPGKEYGLIVDAVGNVAKHARVVEENGQLVIDLCARNWTLDRTDRRTRQAPDDAIPIKTCVSCLGDYPAVYNCCPFCGTKPVPASRSGPEFVDGDILELDPAVLAEMQGGIANITVDEYMAQSGALYLTDPIAKASAAKRFRDKQEAKTALQESIGWWAAWQNQRGRSDSEGYRRFYYRFGVDVLTAQMQSAKEMQELKNTIDNVINTEYNVN